MNRLFLAVLLALICIFTISADLSDTYTGSDPESYGNASLGLTVFPTLSIPLGGRYQGMGTAYTAVSQDSGFFDSNPSASSLLNFSELSFLHNNWIADSTVEGVIYTMRFNDFGIGFQAKFLYSSFTEYDDFGYRAGSGYYSESIATLNVSYNFFSSYFFNGFAVGANVKLAHRNIPAQIFPGQSVLAGLIDIGTLTRFNFLKFYPSRSKNFSVGLVLKNLGPLVMDEPLPTEITLGIAYSPVRPVTVAYDLNVPISYGQPSEDVNMAAGLDVVVTDFFSVQSGFAYKGYNPRLSLGATVDLEKMSFIVNYTLDLTTQFKPFDKFSLEAKLNLGDSGRLTKRSEVDEYFTLALDAFSDGEWEKAVRYLEQALELDPEFKPAIDFLFTVQQRLENKQNLETIQ